MFRPLTSSVAALEESPASTFNKILSPTHEKHTAAEGKQAAGAEPLTALAEKERYQGYGGVSAPAECPERH